jgi:hypothetical protein
MYVCFISDNLKKISQFSWQHEHHATRVSFWFDVDKRDKP